MKTIWKFILDTTDDQVIQMPDGAVILNVQIQHGGPYIWALVDTEADMVDRRIITHGTGHSVSEHAGAYIGTYQLDSGNLVFHVFEYT